MMTKWLAAVAATIGLVFTGTAPALPQTAGAGPTPVPGYVTYSRAFWDGLSRDQRNLVAKLGGTRDDNVAEQPCEILDPNGYVYSVRVVTWKYCNPDKKTYSAGYTFRNGLLVSTFRP